MKSKSVLILYLLVGNLFIIGNSYAGILNDYNPNNVSIPDNGGNVNSDLSLSGAPSDAVITKVGIYYEIRHTYPGDLDVWLTAYYDGSWHDYYLYHQGDLGGTDNIVETRDNIHFWDGASPNQTWYLGVRDKASGNVGYIDFFELWITYETTEPDPNGNLEVTVNNVGGSPVQGARVVRYNPGGGTTEDTTNSSGKIIWNNIPAGTYTCEAYYTGTFLGEEYWVDGTKTVNAGSTASLTLNRIYPYIDNVVFKNNTTGDVLNSTDEVAPGTTVRAEVTVRNKVSQSLNTRVRMLLDQSKSIPYDSDQLSSLQTVSSNGTKTFIFTYAPNETGAWYRAFQVLTTLANGNTTTTDAGPWSQGFKVYNPPNATLISTEFTKERYRKNETVAATVSLQNNDANVLNNVHLSIDFIDPSGQPVAGYESESFSIPALSTYNTPSMQIWYVPLSAYSGAYEPKITLLSSNNQQIASFISGENPYIPILEIGDFPILKNVIIRSQEHFSFSDASSVQTILQEFVNRKLMSISLSVKLDDGEGMWTALSPVPGQVLYNSSIASPKAQNPLSYDLYSRAQSVAQSLEININPWIPTFFDHAQSRFSHPEWKLLNDPSAYPNQDFLDADIEAVRSYEEGLIAEVVSKPYTSPNRVTLDHFRYTNGQHGTDGVASIVNFVREVYESMPAGTELAGYIWLPSDTRWSGQDYTLLNPYIDVFSPMLYWQARQVSSTDDISYSARQYVIDKITEIRNILGASVTEQKVMPTLSITTSVDYSDGGNRNLDDYEWKKTQLNVMGAVADEGLKGYDLFYHGKWLWYVYPENIEKGKWIDWAQYLAGLELDYGSLRVTISPQEAIDAGAQWRRVGTSKWYNSGDIESGIPVGSYTIEFSDITGMKKPLNQNNVVINNGQVSTVSDLYSEITSVNVVPTIFRVWPPFPNPFNPTITISYEIPSESHVSIVIYNITGSKVRVLEDRIHQAGIYNVIWDGRDNKGIKTTSGVYLYSIETDVHINTGKIMHLQ